MEKNYKKFALLMKALSDETRVNILDMISMEELCACKILEEFNITQPTLSYHMKILNDCGLVTSRKDGVWMKYTINMENIHTLREFFNSIGEN